MSFWTILFWAAYWGGGNCLWSSRNQVTLSTFLSVPTNQAKVRATLCCLGNFQKQHTITCGKSKWHHLPWVPTAYTSCMYISFDDSHFTLHKFHCTQFRVSFWTGLCKKARERGCSIANCTCQICFPVMFKKTRVASWLPAVLPWTVLKNVIN